MAWDKTKPENSAYLVSSVLRANWEALAEDASKNNCFGDPDLLIWPDGDAAAPAWWNITSTSVTIARTTASSEVRGGGFGCKMTYSADTITFGQDVLSTSDMTVPIQQGFKGQTLNVGAWVYTTASNCKVFVSQGDATTNSVTVGTGAWTWKTHKLLLTSSATKWAGGVKTAAAGYTIVSQPTFVLGPVVPDYPYPTPISRGDFGTSIAGAPPSTGANKWRHSRPLPFIVEYVQLEALTTASGGDIVVDVNQGSNSMFSTTVANQPTISSGATAGGAEPDGTYQYRCFDARSGASGGDYIQVDLDSTCTSGGQNPSVQIRALTYQPPMLKLRGPNSYK